MTRSTPHHADLDWKRRTADEWLALADCPIDEVWLVRVVEAAHGYWTLLRRNERQSRSRARPNAVVTVPFQMGTGGKTPIMRPAKETLEDEVAAWGQHKDMVPTEILNIAHDFCFYAASVLIEHKGRGRPNLAVAIEDAIFCLVSMVNQFGHHTPINQLRGKNRAPDGTAYFSDIVTAFFSLFGVTATSLARPLDKVLSGVIENERAAIGRGIAEAVGIEEASEVFVELERPRKGPRGGA